MIVVTITTIEVIIMLKYYQKYKRNKHKYKGYAKIALYVYFAIAVLYTSTSTRDFLLTLLSVVVFYFALFKPYKQFKNNYRISAIEEIDKMDGG